MYFHDATSRYMYAWVARQPRHRYASQLPNKYVYFHIYSCIASHIKLLQTFVITTFWRSSLQYVVHAGLKVGRTIWVSWVIFLEGQVGLIRKINYLDVIRILHVLQKLCWHLVSEWSDESTEIQYIIGVKTMQLIISSCFEARGVQRFHL